MKRILCLLFFVPIMSIAQSNLVKGSKIVDLKFGGGKYSLLKYGQVDFGYQYKEKLYARVGLSYESAEVGSTALTVGRVNLDNGFTLLDIQDKVFFNLITGVYFGYESTKSLRNPISSNAFVFGGDFGFEVDVFLTKRLSAKAEILQYYMKNSAVSPWFYTGTVGLSYVFN